METSGWPQNMKNKKRERKVFLGMPKVLYTSLSADGNDKKYMYIVVLIYCSYETYKIK